MQHKIIKLAIAFFVLFSFQGFSQAPEKSDHPLLDKYYPQKQNVNTTKAEVNQINPISQTKPIETKPAPVATITPVPAATTTTATATPVPVAALPTITNVPELTTKPVAATTTNTIIKPTAITAQAPIKKLSGQPAPPPYMDTRLGSSTKQYDTWEKNNNGAGSVTTSSK
ncbi:MAG: hypothetical protein M3Z26_01275 [Bacteroidota bacterium]|nr:hypothetical protein [Bacteroidota bacterium]